MCRVTPIWRIHVAFCLLQAFLLFFFFFLSDSSSYLTSDFFFSSSSPHQLAEVPRHSCACLMIFLLQPVLNAWPKRGPSCGCWKIYSILTEPTACLPMSWVLQWPLVQKIMAFTHGILACFIVIYFYFTALMYTSVERSYLYKPWYIYKTWLRTLKVLYIFIICSRYRLLWTWNWWFPGFCGNRPRDSPDAHEIFSSSFFLRNSSRHAPMSVPFYPCFFHYNDWTCNS